MIYYIDHSVERSAGVATAQRMVFGFEKAVSIMERVSLDDLNRQADESRSSIDHGVWHMRDADGALIVRIQPDGRSTWESVLQAARDRLTVPRKNPPPEAA